MNRWRKALILVSLAGMIASTHVSVSLNAILPKVVAGLPFLVAASMVPYLMLRHVRFRRGLTSTMLVLLGLIVVSGSVFGILYAVCGWIPFYTTYFGTDLLLILWLFLAIYAFQDVDDAEGRREIGRLFAIIVFVVLANTIYTTLNSSLIEIYFLGIGGMHQVVPSFVLAYLLVRVVGREGRWSWRRRVAVGAAIGGALLMIPIYLLGYQRAALLAFFATFMTAVALAILSLARRPGRAFAIMLVFAGLAVAAAPIVGPRFKETRFYRLTLQMEFRREESSFARVLEARDAFKFMADQPVYPLIGFGHGATYKPEASFMAPNVTEDGVVHNIHIGPVLLYFRYGIFGAALWGMMVWVLVRGFFRLRSLLEEFSSIRPAPPQVTRDLILFLTAYFVFLALFVIFFTMNILIDPIMGIALAIVVYMIDRVPTLGPATDDRSAARSGFAAAT